MNKKTQKIADYIHELKCPWSHVDQCGWEYNSWDNPGYERKKYYERAKKLVNLYGADKVIRMIKEHKSLSDILK